MRRLIKKQEDINLDILKKQGTQSNLEILNKKDILSKFLFDNNTEQKNKKNSQSTKKNTNQIKKVKNKVLLSKYIEYLKNKDNKNIANNQTDQDKTKEKYEKIKELQRTQKRKFKKLRYLKIKGRSSLVSNYRNLLKSTLPNKQIEFIQATNKESEINFDLKKNEEIKRDYKQEKTLENLHLTLTVKSNNIFTVLHDIKENRIIKSTSAEQLGFTVSKKRLKTVAPLYVTRFFKNLKTEEDSLVVGNYDVLTVKIIAPARLRKKILKTIRDKFIFNSASNIRANFGFFEIPYLKTFNGCRAAKKIRKKKKGLVIYK